MDACWTILGLGVAAAVLHRWIARDQLQYLRRTYYGTAYQRGYLRLFRDQRAARFLILVAAIGMIVVGLVCLGASR